MSTPAQMMSLVAPRASHGLKPLPPLSAGGQDDPVPYASHGLTSWVLAAWLILRSAERTVVDIDREPAVAGFQHAATSQLPAVAKGQRPLWHVLLHLSRVRRPEAGINRFTLRKDPFA